MMSSAAAFATEYRWDVPHATGDALARYACDFRKPFWAPFAFSDDKTRTITLPGGPVVTERLQPGATHTAYEYGATGVAGIGGYLGSFRVSEAGGTPRLTWRVTFTAADNTVANYMPWVNAGAVPTIAASLNDRFPAPAPR
ncbi:MAG TPA: hypothetical protein VIW69_11620 [Candidatus Elarobacter sp.]